MVKLLDILFPIQCLGCGKEKELICPNCLKKIPARQTLRFNLSRDLSGIITTSFYKNKLLKEAIHKYKYGFVKDLSKPLGKLMAKRLRECLWIKQKEAVLIPVPLHKKRLRWRGFNQAELLAEEVSQQLNIALFRNTLWRTKYRPPQANIKNALHRKENIKQSFSLEHNSGPQNQILKNKTIILIDDISTTNATIKECAKTLKQTGAQEIWGLVLARD